MFGNRKWLTWLVVLGQSLYCPVTPQLLSIDWSSVRSYMGSNFSNSLTDKKFVNIVIGKNNKLCIPYAELTNCRTLNISVYNPNYSNRVTIAESDYSGMIVKEIDEYSATKFLLTSDFYKVYLSGKNKRFGIVTMTKNRLEIVGKHGDFYKEIFGAEKSYCIDRNFYKSVLQGKKFSAAELDSAIFEVLGVEDYSTAADGMAKLNLRLKSIKSGKVFVMSDTKLLEFFPGVIRKGKVAIYNMKNKAKISERYFSENRFILILEANFTRNLDFRIIFLKNGKQGEYLFVHKSDIAEEYDLQ